MSPAGGRTGLSCRQRLNEPALNPPIGSRKIGQHQWHRPALPFHDSATERQVAGKAQLVATTSIRLGLAVVNEFSPASVAGVWYAVFPARTVRYIRIQLSTSYVAVRVRAMVPPPPHPHYP